jgi:glycosyltransferase involved in cell wall biosynthesis
MISVLTGRRGQNPYIDLVGGGADPDMSVRTLKAQSLLWPADIVHIHWPENLFGGKSLPGRIRSRLLWAALDLTIARTHRRGGALVWTAHNTQRHEPLAPALAAFAHDRLQNFYSRVDLAIAMSAAQLPTLHQTFPQIPPARWRVVPHPHYRDIYATPRPRAEVRAALGLGDTALLVTMLGRIRPYKGIVEAIRVFRAAGRADAHLLVAGVCPDPALGAEIAASAAGADNITLRIGHLSDADYGPWQHAADLALFNFSHSLNSGSVLAALSVDRPVLAPHSATLAEMAGRNPDWVQLFEPPLRPDILCAKLDALRTQRPPGAPDLSAHAPDAIQRRHREIYREALQLARRRR